MCSQQSQVFSLVVDEVFVAGNDCSDPGISSSCGVSGEVELSHVMVGAWLVMVTGSEEEGDQTLASNVWILSEIIADDWSGVFFTSEAVEMIVCHAPPTLPPPSILVSETEVSTHLRFIFGHQHHFLWCLVVAVPLSEPGPQLLISSKTTPELFIAIITDASRPGKQCVEIIFTEIFSYWNWLYRRGALLSVQEEQRTRPHARQ